MNKKLFLGMFAAAGMLLATSCSNDELDMVQSGNEAQVTFSLGLEGGIATRAISDGTGAKMLICAVYDADGNVIKTIDINDEAVNTTTGQFVNTNAFQGGLTDQINVTLAKGQTYTMVFWAQNEACKAYTTTDLKAVKVSYKAENNNDNASNNDETRDAFYAAETFKVEGNKEIKVTLKRPFAQINVGVTAEDWKAAVASGITIKESSVVIKNVADEINLLTGAVRASKDMEDGITYALKAIPNDPAILKADANKDGIDEEYQWLSMSYILVNDINTDVDDNGLLGTDQAVLEGLQFAFKPETGESIEFKEGLAGAPVRRNWRTNILGKLLTGDVQFNITIDPAYDDDYIYPNGSEIEQELEFAATFGGTVTLNAPVTLSKTLNVNADMIINLNGQTITGPSEARDADNNRVHAIVNNANLTINGGTITSSATNGGSAINSNGNLTLENVTLNGAPYGTEADKFPSYALNVYGEKTTLKNVTINGTHGAVAANAVGTTVLENCTLTVSGRANSDHVIYISHADAKVIVKGGTYTNNDTGYSYLAYVGNGKLTLENGTFNAPNVASAKAMMTGTGGKIIVKGGIFGFDPSEFVADGYTAIDNGDGTYTVSQNITITNANIAEVLNNLSTTAPTTLVLSEEISLNESVTIPAGVSVTIDLNGNSLTGSSYTTSSGAASLHNVFVNNGELTISGSGEITTRNIINNIGAKLVIDGDITINGGASTGGSAIWNEGKCVIKNVTIKQTNTTNYAIKNAAEGATLIVNDAEVTSIHGAIANDAGTMIINGGSYEVTGASTDHTIYAPNGSVTINGGTFKLSQSNASSMGSTIIDGAVTVNGGTFDAVDGALAYNGQTGLVINGGTFLNKAAIVYSGDFAQFVATTSTATTNADGSITVAAN